MQLTMNAARAIDRISKTVPNPDAAKSAEHHEVIRAYWDAIQVLQDAGIVLMINEFTPEELKC